MVIKNRGNNIISRTEAEAEAEAEAAEEEEEEEEEEETIPWHPSCRAERDRACAPPQAAPIDPIWKKEKKQNNQPIITERNKDLQNYTPFTHARTHRAAAHAKKYLITHLFQTSSEVP